MALCTLHPSLSALASNLELFDVLKLAILESVSDLHILDDNKSANTELPRAQILTLDTLLNSRDEKSAIESLAAARTLLGSLADGDRLLFCEHFQSSQFCKLINGLISQTNASPLVKIERIAPKTVSEILELWDRLGKDYGKANRARDLRQRVEAQILDWTSNFYTRLRGKRVLVISGFSPLIVAGSWISDIIRKIGAIAPELDAENDQTLIDWNYLKNFDPHTIIFAPLGQSLDESKKLFLALENLKGKEKEAFEATSAAKRGEIYFAEGNSNFYSLDYRIIKTLGIIVSAAAGFESGYITDRDTFYKLRYLELHRHKL